MHNFPGFAVVCICAFVGSATLVAAQEEAASPTASPAASPSPTPAASAAPIALADVIAAADADSERLASIDNEVAANQTGANISRDLPNLAKEIDARLNETRRILTPGASLDTMRDLELRWQAVADQLALWSRDLTARATFLDREIGQLPDLRATWRATLELARSSDAPAEVTQRIDALLKAISQTEATLQKRRAAILSLQSRVAEQTQRAVSASRSVKAAQSAAVNRLWVQDSPPIWTPDVRAAARHDLIAESQASLGGQVGQLTTYVGREWTKLVYFALILCAFGFVLANIKRRVSRWTDEDAALARANRILQLPIATASVLTFLVCRPLFPEAPRLFWVSLATAVLVPIVIILRRLIERHLLPILYALLVFYVIAQLRALAAGLPVLSRLILLLEWSAARSS